MLAVLISVSLAHQSLAAYGIQTKTSDYMANQTFPDNACSPGAVLTTSTSIICKVGYTKTVRDVPLSERKKVFAGYGIPYSLHSNYEVDHIVSFELGGSNDIANLFPESYLITNGARIKDKLENYLHAQVCSGKLSIDQAQFAISSNWLEYYNLMKAGALNASAIALPVNSEPTTTPAAAVTVTLPVTKNNPKVVNQSTDSASPAVKKSSTGICHAKGTAYYNQTKKFTAYDSVEECLQSGGRLPK